jgi:ribosomal protein S15P/S13E
LESGEDNFSGDKDYLTPKELVEQAGIGALVHTEVLNKPITPEEAADPVALEATRREMLATAKKISTTAAAMLEERQEAQEVMDGFRQREREVVNYLHKAKKLREHWESMIKDAHKEADKIRRDAISPHKITFATPSNLQSLTTPKENMQKAAELHRCRNAIGLRHHRRAFPAKGLPARGRSSEQAGKFGN